MLAQVPEDVKVPAAAHTAKDIYLGHLKRAKNRYKECLKAAIEVVGEVSTEDEDPEIIKQVGIEFFKENPALVKDIATTFFIEVNRKVK